MDQILAAGLDPHAVVVPTAAKTTAVPPTTLPAVTTNTSPRRKNAKSYKVRETFCLPRYRNRMALISCMQYAWPLSASPDVWSSTIPVRDMILIYHHRISLFFVVFSDLMISSLIVTWSKFILVTLPYITYYGCTKRTIMGCTAMYFARWMGFLIPKPNPDSAEKTLNFIHVQIQSCALSRFILWFQKSRKLNSSCVACRRGLNRKKQFCDSDFGELQFVDNLL